ncbi:hypothetical protein L0244_40770 [bacterium]|nr:hypothetical protein [bacterium]MCI0692377.1 hypothetical protein [candidate division KSB1 bacterium]
MSNYSGYLFLVDEAQRARSIEEHIHQDKTFTDTISALDWQTKQAEIFFIALNGWSIHCAALVRRRRRVATQKYLIRFSNFVEFEPAISISEIQDHLQRQIKHYFIHSSSGMGSRVPLETWQIFFDAVKKLRRNKSSDLDRLDKLREQQPDFFKRQGFEIVVHERDAINLALRMAGFDQSELLDWNPPDGELAPFLCGLRGAILKEDQMINHDTKVFGDWTRIKDDQVGTAIFQHDKERLTVMNVNRHDLEETLGVDLLYYLHKYESYVMVQYKRMTKEGKVLCYRPTDKSYRREIQRMHDSERSFQIDKHPFTLNEYRLHPGVFYFKLCPAEILEPTSADMIPGIYLPLDYWKILVDSSNITGPNEGKRITYENVGRYFNNTFFVELVKTGWIGSMVSAKDVITKIIQESIENKKSVILAAKN